MVASTGSSKNLGSLGTLTASLHAQVFGWKGIRFCYVAILASQFGLAVEPLPENK